MKQVLLILFGSMVMNTSVADARVPSNLVSLLPGAELLFKKIKTKISDVDKDYIFLQTEFYYDPVKKALTPGKGISNKDFIFEVYPTDMNHDGKEEIFIGEITGTTS